MAIDFNSEKKKFFTIQTKKQHLPISGRSIRFSSPSVLRAPKWRMTWTICSPSRIGDFREIPTTWEGDRTYSMDALPQEISPAWVPGITAAALWRYGMPTEPTAVISAMRAAGILEGKYALEGAAGGVTGRRARRRTLEVYLRDPVTGVEAVLLYGVPAGAGYHHPQRAGAETEAGREVLH